MTPLERVQDAAERRLDSEHEFRQALKAAREEGHSWQELADAARMSRAGVRYLTLQAEAYDEQLADDHRKTAQTFGP